jgi:hypothetical protein
VTLPLRAASDPLTIARWIRVVRFAQGFAVHVSHGGPLGEGYYVNRHATHDVATSAARELRRTMISVAWVLTADELDTVLATAALGDA